MKLCKNKLHDITGPDSIVLEGGIKRCRECYRNNCNYKPSKEGKVFLPPETEAIINGYKEPLQPVQDGFGYYGTIAYDKTENYTQCHMCGYFYKYLNKHINSHGITSSEYKIAFGLAKCTSLFATNARTEVIATLWESKTEEEKAAQIARLDSARSNGHHQGGTKRSLEKHNKNGTCPDQLIDKLLRLSDKLGYTPSSSEFQKEYSYAVYKTARSTFGTYTEFVFVAGLAPVVNKTNGWSYTQEQTETILLDFKKRFGREPYYSDIRLHKLPNAAVYKRFWGSWSNAKKEIFR